MCKYFGHEFFRILLNRGRTHPAWDCLKDYSAKSQIMGGSFVPVVEDNYFLFISWVSKQWG